MEKVTKMRRYKSAELAGSQFLTENAAKNKEFAKNDLNFSGLELEDIEADAPAVLSLYEKAIAGYVIPYFDLNGRPLVDSTGYLTMYRTKLQYPPGVSGPKYLSPSGEQLAKYGLPTSLPYIPPSIHTIESEEIICAEGEKKTASIIKHLGLPAFGIGGCQSWREPDGSGKIHSWMRSLLEQRSVKVVTIIPDGDILRYDICAAYGTFAKALEREGYKVKIIHTPDKIDDLLVKWGESAIGEWEKLPALAPEHLVQSSKSLIDDYNLSFKIDSKGRPTVYQHTSNIQILLEQHPAFPKIWLNSDNNRIMIGDTQSEAGLTEMTIANYFQHNLGMHSVNDQVVLRVVRSLSKKNSKSPFLDNIKSQIWDGVERLDTWLMEYWGVEDNEFNREVGAKWLISSCARMEKPGTKIDWIFIVIGPQATGKTSMPNILFNECALTLYGEHDDKDLHMLMHSALCVGFDELDSFGKKEASMLKAMITRNEDAFRPPYGASVELFPRRFTLYGCGNSQHFLQYDPTGYRRYPIVEVNQLLDFSGLEAARNQIWAEAYSRYLAGGSDYWTIKNASEKAVEYVVPNIIAERVDNWIETAKKDPKSTNVSGGMLYFTVVQILDSLQLPDHKAREIAVLLRARKDVEFPKYPITGPLGGPIKKRYYKVAVDS